MDKSTRTYLQMWDRVSLLEPQLREAQSANRELAMKAVEDCYRELSFKIDAEIDEEAEHIAWMSARQLACDAEERRKAIIAMLEICSRDMKKNYLDQNENHKKMSEAGFAFLRSLSVQESVAKAVETYIAHESELNQWRMVRATGGYSSVPGSISREVYDVVLPLFERDTSGVKTIFEGKGASLYEEGRRLSAEFEQHRLSLEAEVKEMDAIDEAADKATLAAAKSLLGKLSVYKREEPRLKRMAVSAIEVCNAVKLLSKRIAVVKLHPRTLSEKSQGL
ncbi:MAG: hypothetical protein P4L53_03865 [Candidatus Obscuribacterales bacterium]|nr:hypothetical protein [Candidatus Obscuribacterales bacterium]